MRNSVNAAESLEDIQKDYDSQVAKYNSDMEAYEKSVTRITGNRSKLRTLCSSGSRIRFSRHAPLSL